MTFLHFFPTDYGIGMEVTGLSAALFILIPICIFFVICALCRKWCRNANNPNGQQSATEQQAAVPNNYENATNNYHPPGANRPYTPAMDTPYRPVPTAPPPIHTNFPAHQPQTVALPSAPDLPPGYDAVMDDPNKYGMPPTNGVIPVTPPPAYTPQTVMFNSDANTVNLNVAATGESHQQQMNTSES